MQLFRQLRYLRLAVDKHVVADISERQNLIREAQFEYVEPDDDFDVQEQTELQNMEGNQFCIFGSLPGKSSCPINNCPVHGK